MSRTKNDKVKYRMETYLINKDCQKNFLYEPLDGKDIVVFHKYIIKKSNFFERHLPSFDKI